MAQHVIPEMVRVINSPTKYPITFNADANEATAFTVATVGTTKNAHISRFSLTRGILAQKPKYRVTAATAAEITAATTIPSSSKLFLEIEIGTTGRELRFANHQYNFSYTLHYDVALPSGTGTVTAGKVLFAIHKAINQSSGEDFEFLLKASVAPTGTLGADTLDILSLDVQQPKTFIKSIKLLGEDDEPSVYVTTFAPVEYVQFVAPRGDGNDIEFREKLIEHNNTPYWKDFTDIPVEGQLYTQVAWEWTVQRPDPKAHDLSSKVRRVIYLNEATCESVIDSLGDYFLTTPSTRFTNLANDGVSVSFNDAEAIVVATDAAATQIDSSDYGVSYILGAAAGTDPKYLVLESLVPPADAEGNATVLAKFKTNA